MPRVNRQFHECRYRSGYWCPVLSVLICPNCHSRDIYPSSRLYGLPTYRCRRCGYSGKFIIGTGGNTDLPELSRPIGRYGSWEQPPDTSRRNKILTVILILVLILLILFRNMHGFP